MKNLVGAKNVAIDRVMLPLYSWLVISLRRLLPIDADNDVGSLLLLGRAGNLNPAKEIAAPADCLGCATSERATKNTRAVVPVGIQVNGGIILGAN